MSNIFIDMYTFFFYLGWRKSNTWKGVTIHHQMCAWFQHLFHSIPCHVVNNLHRSRIIQATYMASHRLAENKRWIAWSFIWLDCLRYPSIIWPVWVVRSVANGCRQSSHTKAEHCSVVYQETWEALCYDQWRSNDRSIVHIESTCRIGRNLQQRSRVLVTWYVNGGGKKKGDTYSVTSSCFALMYNTAQLPLALAFYKTSDKTIMLKQREHC